MRKLSTKKPLRKVTMAHKPIGQPKTEVQLVSGLEPEEVPTEAPEPVNEEEKPVEKKQPKKQKPAKEASEEK